MIQSAEDRTAFLSLDCLNMQVKLQSSNSVTTCFGFYTTIIVKINHYTKILRKSIKSFQFQSGSDGWTHNSLMFVWPCISDAFFNINSQQDATIIILLIISISSKCFGRNYRPKHVELIQIINTLLLLHLAGCLLYCLKKYSIQEEIKSRLKSRECLLSFGAESFVFRFAIQKFKKIYRIIMFPVVYGCETWSLTLRVF